MGASSQRSWATLVLRFVGLVASLALVGHLIDLRQAARTLLVVPVGVSVLSVMLVAARVVVGAARWRILMPPNAGLSLGRLVRLTMAGGAVAPFVPGMLGPDMARSLGAFREAASDRGEAAWSVVTDRIVGVGTTLLIGLGACLVAEDLVERWRIFAAFGLLAVTFLGLMAVVTSARLHRGVVGLIRARGRAGAWGAARLEELFGAVRVLRGKPRRLASAILASVAVQVLWFIVVWAVARSLDIDVGFFGLGAATTLVGVATSVPITLGGIGVREVGFVYLLSSQGSSDAAVGALALYQSALIVLFAGLGLPFLWAEIVRHPAKEKDAGPP